MGTRSDIIVHLSNGDWKRIYCHWDGYLSHNGAILQEHYNSQARAEELVEPGDLSSLRPRCDKPEGHTFDKPTDGVSNYYGRDRGETDVAGVVGKTLQEVWPPEDTWTEFTYVWKDGQWFVADADEGGQALVPLAAALAGEAPVTPSIKVPFLGVAGKHAPVKKSK